MDADSAARRQRVRQLALVLGVLCVAVVCISAYVRLAAAGIDCADWPACYGQVLAGKANLHGGIPRMLHRLGASSALLLAFVLAWQSMQPHPLQPAGRRAVALVVLMMFLAAIGIWSADPHRAWVSFINILGGLGLVALSWRVVLATGAGARAPAGGGFALKAGVAALLATVALGALIGARYAAVSCATLPACGNVWWPPTGGWAALDPFTVIAAALPPGDAGGVTLHLLHRYCAVATLLLLGIAGHRALRQPQTRRAAAVLLALLAAEIMLGVLTVAGGFSLWLAIGHSVGAALLLAAATGCRGAAT